MSISSSIGHLEGKSTFMMFGNCYFGSKGYFTSTVGLNEARIKYIWKQEKTSVLRCSQAGWGLELMFRANNHFMGGG